MNAKTLFTTTENVPHHVRTGDAASQKLTRSVADFETLRLANGDATPATPDAAELHRRVRENLPFVVSTARRYTTDPDLLMELVAEGNVGLLEAARRYDESRDVGFLSYAVWWVRRYIVRALEREWRHGMREVCESRLEDHRAATLGTDGEDAEPDAMERFGATDEASPEEMTDRSLERERLEERLRTLSPRERKVLVMSFGLDGEASRTDEEMARHLHLAPLKVKSLQKAALQKVTQRMATRRWL